MKNTNQDNKIIKFIFYKIFPNIFKNILPIISIFISIIFFILNYNLNQNSTSLSYYVNPYVKNATHNSFDSQLEFKVTNGAIGNIIIFSYDGKEIYEYTSYKEGTISQQSSFNKRVFKEKINYDKKTDDEFILVRYILVYGKNGSKQLDMLLYHITPTQIISSYYSQDEVYLKELSSDYKNYSSAISYHKELIQKLKKDGVLTN